MGIVATKIMKDNAKKRVEELNKEVDIKENKVKSKYIIYPLMLLIVSILVFVISVMFYY